MVYLFDYIVTYLVSFYIHCSTSQGSQVVRVVVATWQLSVSRLECGGVAVCWMAWSAPLVARVPLQFCNYQQYVCFTNTFPKINCELVILVVAPSDSIVSTYPRSLPRSILILLTPFHSFPVQVLLLFLPFLLSFHSCVLGTLRTVPIRRFFGVARWHGNPENSVARTTRRATFLGWHDARC